MTPALKIIAYLLFVICIFLIDNLLLIGMIFLITFFILLCITPVKIIVRGWIPIIVLLMFTFISNLLFRHGEVIFLAGPLVVTSEGLTDASVKTARILLMIAGAKLMTSTTSPESLVRAFGRILKPLQLAGIPVNEFTSTMGLTIKSLPLLKEQFLNIYREKVLRGNVRGFWNRARIAAGLLMPLFIQSIRAPERFLEGYLKDSK